MVRETTNQRKDNFSTNLRDLDCQRETKHELTQNGYTVLTLKTGEEVLQHITTTSRGEKAATCRDKTGLVRKWMNTITHLHIM